VIIRALDLFDEIIIAIGLNAEKRPFFPVEQRIAWIKRVFADYPKISVQSYSGLTIDFCRSNNARYILRGLRTSADFEFERSIGQMNIKMNPGIETVFLLTLPEYSALTSSIVRDIIRNGGNPAAFIPEAIRIE